MVPIAVAELLAMARLWIAIAQEQLRVQGTVAPQFFVVRADGSRGLVGFVDGLPGGAGSKGAALQAIVRRYDVVAAIFCTDTWLKVGEDERVEALSAQVSLVTGETFFVYCPYSRDPFVFEATQEDRLHAPVVLIFGLTTAKPDAGPARVTAETVAQDIDWQDSWQVPPTGTVH